MGSLLDHRHKDTCKTVKDCTVEYQCRNIRCQAGDCPRAKERLARYAGMYGLEDNG